MRRMLMLASASVVAAGLWAASASAEDKMTLVGWGGAASEAINKAVVQPFMQKTGVKVTEDGAGPEMAKIRAMVEAGTVTWDVVQIESGAVIDVSGSTSARLAMESNVVQAQLRGNELADYPLNRNSALRGSTGIDVFVGRPDGPKLLTLQPGGPRTLLTKDLKPGHTFRGVDALITNFHLPRSTLLVLVAALIGREALRRAYNEAIQQGYRFFSYGDAMLVL